MNNTPHRFHARLTALLLTLVLLLGTLPVTASAAQFGFGSAQTPLAPGTYAVPIALRHADKHEKPSAAASAFPAEAQLTVREDGTAALTTGMQAVSMAGLSDMAYNVKVYQGNSYNTETVNAQVLETTVKPGEMVNPGVTVPTKITFEIPDTSWDGVYLSLWVDAMATAPDAWLEIDYEKAIQPGESRVYSAVHEVFQFGQYDVHVNVTVTDGLIAGVDISADRYCKDPEITEINKTAMAKVTAALHDAWNGLAPTADNAEAIYRVIEQPDVVDSISGATYSAKGVRDAVMKAFSLSYEPPIVLPEHLDAGVYEVEIAYYAEVGHHSLVENDTAKATVTVSPDGSMRMALHPVSGTEKEPMYIMNMNGVYPGNDRTNPLTAQHCTQHKTDIAFEDQYFPEETQVVDAISFPMYGGFQPIYYTNMYLYVPAMNNLNGVLHGVLFENGRFNTDICAKVYWDTIQRTGDLPEVPAEQAVTADSAALRGTPADQNGHAAFILGLTDPRNISAIQVSFSSPVPVQAEGLNGFSLVGQKDGTAVLVYLGSGQLTADGLVDAVRFTTQAAPEQDVTLTITDLTIAGRDSADQECYGTIAGGIVPDRVTAIVNSYDLTGDGVVDLLDVVAAQDHYRAEAGDADWADAQRCDFDRNQVVDVLDLVELFRHFSA